jgi:hypothetical protein
MFSGAEVQRSRMSCVGFAGWAQKETPLQSARYVNDGTEFGRVT